MSRSTKCQRFVRFPMVPRAQASGTNSDSNGGGAGGGGIGERNGKVSPLDGNILIDNFTTKCAAKISEILMVSLYIMRLELRVKYEYEFVQDRKCNFSNLMN